jgi:hypothetical protein
MTTTDDEEKFPPVQADDPPMQQQYLQELRWRFPNETGAIDGSALEAAVQEGLKLCPPLRISDPKEVRRFLALTVVLTPEQKQSDFLKTVVYRVLMAFHFWGARKRMNFIYTFVVGRAPPEVEPDFGVWFIADPKWYPGVTPDDLGRAIFSSLPASAAPPPS